MYLHQTDTVQINALEYNLDIDRDNQPNTDKKHTTVSVQGTLNTSQESSVLEDDNSIAPDNITTLVLNVTIVLHCLALMSIPWS